MKAEVVKYQQYKFKILNAMDLGNQIQRGQFTFTDTRQTINGVHTDIPDKHSLHIYITDKILKRLHFTYTEQIKSKLHSHAQSQT
jgi:hypothetical protein